jgi:hypothetical protein
MTDLHPSHRILRIGSKGPDVTALQRETDQRLAARGEDEYKVGRHDGELGPKTARGISRAAYLLGAGRDTWEAARIEHGGEVSVGLQRMIRHPGVRNDRQLKAARARLAATVERRHAAADKAAHPTIAVATAAMKLLLRNAPAVHYTQGPSRWQGITDRLHASRGLFPRYADCSSAYTWALWNLLGDGPDIVNGADWKGGYTGTLLAHGRPSSEGHEGAAVLYGRRGSTGSHVAYNLGNGQVISHGSEGGPYLLPIRYRSDLMAIKAYV